MPIASALRFALRWFGFALIASISPLVRAQSTSTAADGFDPNINGNVYAVAVQPDGKILVAGSFTSAQPNGGSTVALSNIARLLPSGRLDSFTSSVNGQINAMALQADGKIVIGGKFTAVSGTVRNRAARLNADGSLDATFDPNVGGGLTPEVSAVAVQPDGKVLIGGGFITAQPNGTGTVATRNRIARFNANGTLDAFDPNANSVVLAIAVQSDGRILLGGGFTTLGSGGTARNRIARVNADGSLDASFDPKANNAIAAIELQPDGKILIGGSFTTLQPNNADTAIAVTNMARLNADGTVSSTFLANANGPVSTIKLHRDGGILVGGAFSGIGGGSRSYAVRLFPNGALDNSIFFGPNFSVYAFGVQSDSSVILAGGFTTMSGTGRNSTIRNHVARVTAAGGLDADFRPDANGRLQSLALLSDGKIMVGGSFTSIAGQTRRGIARLSANGTLDTSFNVDVDGVVLGFAQQTDGKLIIIGSFSRVGGLSRSNIARLKTDNTVDEGFDPAPSGQVTTVALQSDGKILIGGGFSALRPNSTTEPVSRSAMARINADGTLDVSFNPTPNSNVNAIVVQPDGKILVGGAFTTFNANGAATVGRRGLARVNADGTLDAAFDPNVDGIVSSILLQTDNKVVFAGSFIRMAPAGATTVTTRNNIGRVNADGTLDAAFDPNANAPVNALALQSDGHILVGGRFTTLQPNSGTVAVRNFAARLNSDGTVDTGFNLNLDTLPGNQVVGFAQNSSQLLVGGAFTSVGGGGTPVARNRLARVNPASGVVDTSFTSDVATAGGAPIESLVTLSDGSILAAGSFSGLNGAGSSNIAGFTADGVPNFGFAPTINGPVHTVAQLPARGAPRATQHGGFAWLQSNGELRSDFSFGSDPNVGSIVAVAVQPDGKMLTGSLADSGTIGSLSRYNANGTRDTSFTPAATGTINTIAVQPDKKILVGGEFSTIAGVTRNNMARLNEDGTPDANFNPNVSAQVLAIELQSDGKIIIGGNFTSLQPNTATTSTGRNFIARLNGDGTLDTNFNPNTNSTVRKILAQADGKIWIGGNFTALQPNGAATPTGRGALARLSSDGSLDAIDLKLNGAVGSLAAQSDGKIVVGGTFTSIGGVTQNYLARITSEGVLDPTFNPNPNAPVSAVSIQPDGKILVGGGFTAVEPGATVYNPATATPRNRAVRLNPDGSIDASFNPNFDSNVSNILTAGNGTVIAVGSFSAVQPSGSLLVAGAFTRISGLSITNVVLFGNDGSISSTFQPNPNGAVFALSPQPDGQVVIGGSFTNIAGSGRGRIARFRTDDTLDPGFNPNADGDVFSIVRQADGKLLVGGSFNNIGGAGRSNLARLNTDGSNDASFTPAVGAPVRAIAVQADGRVLISSGTGTASSLMRLNTNGSADGTFNAGNNGSVSSIAVQTDGHIVVGGSFTTIGGGSRNYLARLNANGALDSTGIPVPNGAVTALTIQGDGKILIGGVFSLVDDLPRFGLARISAPTPVTESFTVDASHSVITWTRSGGAPEIDAANFEISSDNFNWSTAGQGSRIGASTNWTLSGAALSATASTYVRVRGIVPASPNSSAGLVGSQTQFYFGNDVPATPVINSATAVSAASGSSFLYAISATGFPTSYSATGLPAGLTLNTATGVISGTPTQTGSFNVVLTATNALGTGTTTLTLFVGAPGSTSDAGRVVNLSVLANVTSSNPIIAGFVITGSSPQSILLRAIGPGLSTYGVTGVLSAPNLKIYNSAGLLLQEINSWGGGATLAQEFARLGAFPLTATSTDAAVIVTLAPGPYSIHVSDPGTAGGSAMAEVYDASATPPLTNSPHLVNISARGIVSAGHNVTGGFVITGTTAKKMLIRGIGPALAGQGVASPLSDPIVSLNHIGTGVIATNNNWQTPVTTSANYPAASAAEISAAAAVTGGFALTTGSADAAILVTLAPGIYSADVSGSGGATGAAMVEVYEVP
ncbi:MAG: putative Ig domain-containing protein [Opitutus sp.]